MYCDDTNLKNRRGNCITLSDADSPTARRDRSCGPPSIYPDRRNPLSTKRNARAGVVGLVAPRLVALLTLVLLVLVPSITRAQARLEREGVALYWGLVPAAVASEKHALENMHGAIPNDGGEVHHLLVALFDARGQRIEDAVVRAQLSETGIVDEPPKYLTPMSVNGQMTYAQLFSAVRNGPYRFRVFVKLPNRATDIEFAVSAWSPHREIR